MHKSSPLHRVASPLAWLSTLALLTVTACAPQQPFSSLSGGKYKTVALHPEIKAPAHYIYRDISGKRSRGMLGGILGLMLGAASEGPGYRRFDAAASKNSVDIRALVRRHMENALRGAKMLQLVPANADTTLKIEIIAYGAGPVNRRELGGIIAARATLTGRSGEVIWKKDEWAASRTTALLETLEGNPSLWPVMANEAAEELAKKLILVTSATARTVAAPFM